MVFVSGRKLNQSEKFKCLRLAEPAGQRVWVPEYLPVPKE